MTEDMYSARTVQQLRALAREHDGVRVVGQLSDNDLKKPASRWNIRHLVAYRLLTVQSHEEFLNSLEIDHNDHCPCCGDDRSTPQTLDYQAVRQLVDGFPPNLPERTESELLRLPAGFFWVALSRAMRSDQAEETRELSRRERRPVDRSGFVSSAATIQGSSSPTIPSSSEFEVDLEDVDEDEHDSRRNKPEEVTVHLIMCFLQCVLNLCLIQHVTGGSIGTEIRPRVDRMLVVTRIAGTVNVSAEDDGGICKMRRSINGWEMIHAHLALLEAKRAFKRTVINDKSGEVTPVVSNENLAQYLGEAVIAWKKHQKLLRDDILVIAATSTFVRFMHFKFGRNYAEYLDISDKTAQVNFIDDEKNDAVVYLHSTKWFNLQSSEGRRIAMCHVFAILRWHDNYNAVPIPSAMSYQEDSDQDSSDSMLREMDQSSD